AVRHRVGRRRRDELADVADENVGVYRWHGRGPPERLCYLPGKAPGAATRPTFFRIIGPAPAVRGRAYFVGRESGRGGTRTHTPVRAHDFESCMSADSITRPIHLLFFAVAYSGRRGRGGCVAFPGRIVEAPRRGKTCPAQENARGARR